MRPPPLFDDLVIARKGHSPYLSQMVALVLRLLAVAALFLMPLGMVTPASAHGGEVTLTTDGHCGDADAPAGSRKTLPQVHCAASCTALPAIPAVVPSLAPVAPDLPHPAVATRIVGQHPEIATPPPKDS